MKLILVFIGLSMLHRAACRFVKLDWTDEPKILVPATSLFLMAAALVWFWCTFDVPEGLKLMEATK